jgi:hypothetical protein
MIVTEETLAKCVGVFIARTRLWAPEEFGYCESVADLLEDIIDIAVGADEARKAHVIEERAALAATMTLGTLLSLDPEYKDYLVQALDREELANPEFYRGFISNRAFVYLAEISQMPGHIVVAGKDGKVYSGFHDDSFFVMDEEDC